MFIGHFAVGFASKRAAPRASLGVLMAAPLFADLLWPIFLIAGVESVRIEPGNTAFTPLDLHDFPWSHSLATSVAWSLVIAALFWAATRYGRGAVVVAIGVFSHFVLDFVTHRPDLPLYPGSATSVGLGLWNSRNATLAVEVPLFLIGVAIYARTTRAINWRGAIAFWALVVFLAVFYVADVFGPPPPSVDFIKYGGLTGWLFLPWAWWIDRNREIRAAPAAVSVAAAAG
jgi:membrane-bound metal-dependent hydrolase YbcI (DUF457 family)